jgi:hypothetical protein
MSRSFDYQSATPEQIAVRLNSVQKQAYFRLITYYTKKNNLAMVAKLQQARKLAKILELQHDYAKEYGV